MRRTAYILDKAPNFATCGHHIKGHDASQWKQSNQSWQNCHLFHSIQLTKDMIDNNYTSLQVRKQYLCCTSTQKCNHIVKDGESCNIVIFKLVNLDDSLTSSFMSMCTSLFSVLLTVITQREFSVPVLCIVALHMHWTLLIYNSLEKQASVFIMKHL